uniref:Uncharacterized protein n=1 Tax=Aplanochytrium stocchinoi TaxID=215587 RepID=A0A7S3UYB5_9STRA|mmetsp:Transcript_16251/g.19378  ORF Transcript_16251/g.19378 Transcript_16251/m.19378 type:complete len:363 (-) Transcript_16251:106-1194(-)
MSCVSLKPAPKCGFFGTCVNETICICEDGWSVTKELAFFVDEENAEGNVCNFNQNILTGLYIGVEICACIGVLLQLYVRQMHRLDERLFLTSFLLQICFSTYRILKPDVALLGTDLTFSLLVCNAGAIGYVGIIEFFREYLIYLSMASPFGNGYVQRTAKVCLKLKRVISALVLLLFQCFWLSTLFPENKEFGLLLVRLYLTAAVIFGLYLSVITFSMYHYVEDMERVRKFQGIRTGNEIERTLNFINTVVPQTKYLRNVVRIANVGTVIMLVLPIFWDFAFQQLTYVVPLDYIFVIVVGGYPAILIHRNNSKAMLKFQQTDIRSDSNTTRTGSPTDNMNDPTKLDQPGAASKSKTSITQTV